MKVTTVPIVVIFMMDAPLYSGGGVQHFHFATIRAAIGGSVHTIIFNGR